MATLFQSFPRRDIPVLPAKRLVAIDPGHGTVKILVVQEVFGRLRVLASEQLEVRGPSAGEATSELRQRVPDRVRALGSHPVALALPHYRALSQVIDLPPSDTADIRRLIEEETVKLSGLDESTIVHDYVGLEPFGRHTNPYWVTLCRGEEIQSQTDRCGLGAFDLCEVTTTANALAAAYLASTRRSEDAVLVDFGANGTTVVLLNGGQAVDAATFPIGGDALTEALAAGTGADLEAAEAAKRSSPFPAEAKEGARLRAVVGEWSAELRRILREWTEEHPGLVVTPESFPVVLGGGQSAWPGLLEYLRQTSGLQFEAWPSDEGCPVSAAEAVAFGVAMQALGKTRQPASLLPAEVRLFWRRQHSVTLLHWVIVCLLGLTTLLLGLVTWQKWAEYSSKEMLMTNIRSALGMAISTETLSRQLAEDYERLRPVLARQRQTMDALQTLALLQTVRSNQTFWYVLFADHLSYFTAVPWGTTNAAATGAESPVTNSAMAALATTPGFVVELCVPEEGDALRQTLSRVVAELKQSRLFTNVDSLSIDRRRSLVDPQVLLPDRHFSLNLETGGDYARPLAPPERRRAPASTVTTEGRSSAKAIGSTNVLERGN